MSFIVLINTIKNAILKIAKVINKIIVFLIVFILKCYQRFISPILKHFGVKCKYYPSCSEYMKQALEKYGCIKGMYLGIKRLLRCNPFSKGGYDPLN